MSTARGGTCLAVALLLAGCTTASTPAEAPSQAASVAARSAALSAPSPRLSAPAPEPTAPPPEPTAPPLTVDEAGAAFQKAELAFGRLLFELGETYRDKAPCAWTVGFAGAVCTESQLAAGKAYFVALSTGLDEYVAQLQAIAFPDVAVAEANAFLKALVNEQRAAHAVVDAQTLESFNELADTAVAALRGTTGSGQALADALGVEPPDAP
jgi:hypothetical protein